MFNYTVNILLLRSSPPPLDILALQMPYNYYGTKLLLHLKYAKKNPGVRVGGRHLQGDTIHCVLY